MPSELREQPLYAISDNAWKLIADDWMLVTAGTIDSFNTMTASWGAVGELWHRKIAICFIRPQRYTYQFTEKHDRFTLSFFDESWRGALNLCGTKSGRDVDKMAATGLTPAATSSGGIYFTQARIVLECIKIYTHDLDPDKFLDPTIAKEYPREDYHRMYLGQIERCLLG